MFVCYAKMLLLSVLVILTFKYSEQGKGGKTATKVGLVGMSQVYSIKFLWIAELQMKNARFSERQNPWDLKLTLKLQELFSLSLIFSVSLFAADEIAKKIDGFFDPWLQALIELLSIQQIRTFYSNVEGSSIVFQVHHQYQRNMKRFFGCRKSE